MTTKTKAEQIFEALAGAALCWGCDPLAVLMSAKRVFGEFDDETIEAVYRVWYSRRGGYPGYCPDPDSKTGQNVLKGLKV